LASAAIKPLNDRVFSFDEVRQALDFLALGRARGKVVVQLV
jgi:NADPH:quinone reductase-like Zn-dependent oxidoreductase